MRGWSRACLLAGLLLLCAAPAGADLATGRLAYEAGNFGRALQLLLPEAERGNAEAQFMVGAIYGEGAKDVRANRAMAIDWYLKAAEQGNPAAQYELFMLAGDRNSEAAGSREVWARRLALQGPGLEGHARSQAAYCAEYLGLMHARGLGPAPDRIEGYGWLALAVELGRQEAAATLELLAGSMSAQDLAAAKIRPLGR
jgi:uncharacterized protein